MADGTTAEGEQLKALQTSLPGGRLTRLPAKSTRRKEVLRYLAMRDYQPRAWYSEAKVNEVPKSWCEGTDDTDYVSVRGQASPRRSRISRPGHHPLSRRRCAGRARCTRQRPA
jgi:hypothetical protein